MARSDGTGKEVTKHCFWAISGREGRSISVRTKQQLPGVHTVWDGYSRSQRPGYLSRPLSNGMKVLLPTLRWSLCCCKDPRLRCVVNYTADVIKIAFDADRQAVFSFAVSRRRNCCCDGKAGRFIDSVRQLSARGFLRTSTASHEDDSEIEELLHAAKAKAAPKNSPVAPIPMNK